MPESFGRLEGVRQIGSSKILLGAGRLQHLTMHGGGKGKKGGTSSYDLYMS